MAQADDRRNHRKRWRPEEAAYIWANIGTSSRALAKKFGRSPKAVDAVKHKLRENARKYAVICKNTI